MPPKAKLNKLTGKQKGPLPQNQRNNSNNVANNNGPELSPEAQQQFEVELCWCIQQLQNALKNGKLSPKQVQDHTKAMNALMSNSTSLIKKRQVMRLSFGDYRAKMTEENKKHMPGVAKIKIIPTKANNKSVFIKKSIFNATNKDFKFNFDIKPEVTTNNTDPNGDGCSIVKSENTLLDNISNIKLEESNVDDRFNFVQSDNAFRFNFAINN